MKTAEEYELELRAMAEEVARARAAEKIAVTELGMAQEKVEYLGKELKDSREGCDNLRHHLVESEKRRVYSNRLFETKGSSFGTYQCTIGDVKRDVSDALEKLNELFRLIDAAKKEASEQK